MESSDETAPVYEPDFDPGSVSDDTMFDADSLSTVSMNTITSDEVAGYFRSINGLLFSSDENIPTVNPINSDAPKIELLVHIIFRLYQDGRNVPPEAAQVLQECQRPSGAMVLDMMMGTGIWVQEMAQEYSTATFVSINTIPMIPHKPHPRITYEVYDVYAGIAEPDESFDFVRASICVGKTKDFNFLLREMYRVLKPNGMLLLMEMPAHETAAGCPSEPLHSSPNRDHCIRLIRQLFELQGVDTKAWDDMSDRLSPNNSLWSERSIDPAMGIVEHPGDSGGSRGFYSILQHTRITPQGPWHEDKAQQILGSFTGALMIWYIKTMRPFLSMMGIEQADAQNLIDKAMEELKDNKIRRTNKCCFWSARKIPVQYVDFSAR